MSAPKVKVGVVGCGNISDLYIRNMKRFAAVEVAACADLVRERAAEKAAKLEIPKACTPDELLADPKIELVVNITVTKAHGPVGEAALKAGKNLYNEKPIAADRAAAQRLLALAKDTGLRLGGAPDPFLGAALQTARKLIDEGRIGEPVAASSFMMSRGPERWHPDPEFMYQPGGGPLPESGPYSISALANLIGPVRKVTAMSRSAFKEREIMTGPRSGTKFNVDTPTHVSTMLEFANGAMGTLITSFDTWPGKLPPLEIYGSEGTLSLPVPALFGGEILFSPLGKKEWEAVPLVFGYTDKLRGLGVADMASAMRSGRPHRASAELAYHVADVIFSINESSASGRGVEVNSTFERPAPMAAGLPEWTLD